MTSTAAPQITRREWLWLAVFIVVMLAITAIPYVYAHRIAPPDNQFMGVVVNIPDHFQYFSWMRESQDKVLVPNQLTPETSAALLFNLLWWVLGRIEALTGLDYIALYQIIRLAAGALAITGIYFFTAVVFQNVTKRRTATLVAVLASGIGYIWIILKYVPGVPDTLFFPFTIYTAEPNTAYTIMAFPHFTIATGLIAIIFALVLIAQRNQSLRYAWIAAAVTLFLSLQHAYDMFTIYGVIGVYGLFLWIRDRKFPLFLFKAGLIIVLVSVWPALQAFLITNADEVWKGVLAQFDNAGAWTPSPILLPFLMGFGWLLAIWALDIRTPWRERDDTHLFLLAWFLSHFVLIYIPLNFQIHLLSGWQVVIGVLATIGLYTRVLPRLKRWFKAVPENRLRLWAAVGLIAIVIPNNLYLFAQRFIDLRRANASVGVSAAPEDREADDIFFLTNGEVAAMKYLETKVTGEDVVLSSLNIGQFVPALTGGRAFLGHWAQTLDFYGKRDRVNAFFDPNVPDSEREQTLRKYGVDYVFYSPEEARLGSYDLSNVPFLTTVFDQDGVKVFKVELSG